MKPTRSALWALLAVVVGSTLLRLYVFSAGPDLDTDAYGHAVLGRYTWDDPGNLQIHWVWLPLWHFFFGVVGWLGLGFQSVRVLDIALSGLIPVLVFYAVLRARRGYDERVAVLGALFAAFFPIAITHGQSGEPEALFAVLILVAAFCIECNARLPASIPLGVAVLLRFEAWAVLPAFAVASVLLVPAGAGWPRRLVRGAVAVVVPGLVIVAYVILHRRAYDGRWLVFLTENHAFVQEARTHAVPGLGPQPVWYWYVAALPYRTAGPVVVLALVGLWRFLRHAPITYRVVGPWLLAFVSYGWVREQHLGLDRHFFAVVPFFAVAMAEGAVLVADHLAARIAEPRRKLVAMLTLSVAACGLLGFSVHHAHGHALAAAHAFEPERAMAAVLAAQAPGVGAVYCSWGKVEVLSGLGPDRFAGADAVRERGGAGAPVVIVDDVAHRDRWPASWRSVGSTPQIVVLAGP